MNEKENFDNIESLENLSAFSKFEPSSKEIQLELFSSFLLSKPDYSHTFPIYDIIPKFILSKIRAQKTLKIRTFSNIKIGEKKVKSELTPAIIEKENGIISIFPGAREELIERTLRFMAVQQNINLCLEFEVDNKKHHQISVVFTLYALRKQMAKDGHNFKLSEIKEGLEVMQKCNLRVTGDINSEYVRILSGPLLSIPDQITTKFDDGDGKRTAFKAVFHPLATQSILEQSYFLIRHNQLMKLRIPLARWIISRINARYRQASKSGWIENNNNGDASGYRLTLRQILEESGIEPEPRLRNTIDRVRLALKELQKENFLHFCNPFKENPIFELTKGRAKIVNME